jgi:hypothetical protein
MVLELLQQHGIEPRKKAGTHGGEYCSPCPACGGNDRFMSWPEQGEHGTWWCRGCGKGGDAIEFLRVFDGLSFSAACDRLGVSREYSRRPLAMPKQAGAAAATFAPKDHPPPSPVWQKKAAELLDYAHKQLLAAPEELAKLAARGLPLAAVMRFRLGLLPGERIKKTGEIRDCYYRGRASWGLPDERNDKGEVKKLWIPRGLVVPVLGSDGSVLRLRIRRFDADRARFSAEMKYVVVPGSYMGSLISRHMRSACGSHAMVVVESELDAMACQYAADQAGLPVGSLAVGTNRGKPDAVAHALLAASLTILVALDFDPPDKRGNRPGAQGFAWWHGQYRQAERWPSALGKDVGEGVAQGMDIATWLRAGLPPVLTGCAPAPAPPVQDAQEDHGAVEQESIDYLILTPADGREIYLTSDQDLWDQLSAEGKVVFSHNEMLRLQAACSTMDDAERAQFLGLVADAKEVFNPATIRRGEAVEDENEERVSPGSSSSPESPDECASEQESQPSCCVAARGIYQDLNG